MHLPVAGRDSALKAAKLATQSCFSHPFARRYDFLPDWLNQLLCTYNQIFLAQLGTPQSKALANIFGRLQYTSSAILAYESFRQPGFGARRALWWLLLSQATSIGATLPLYFALCASRSAQTVAKSIKPEQSWSILAALLAGYIAPTIHVMRSKWTYDALSIWQAYPLLMVGICSLLPMLIRPFFDSISAASPEKRSRIPVIGIAAIGVALSMHAHFKFLGSGIDFRDLVHIFDQKSASPAGSITPAAHLVFLFDMVSSFIAGCAHVVLCFHGENAERKFGYCIVLVALTNFIGPGGALAVVWAIRETYGVALAQKTVARMKANKAK